MENRGLLSDGDDPVSTGIFLIMVAVIIIGFIYMSVH